MSTSFLDPTNSVERQREKRIAASRRQWSELPAKDLERHDVYFADRASGNLFVLTRGAVLPGGDVFGHGPKVDAFYVNRDGEPIYLTRSQSPSTLDELRVQEAAKEAAQRERQRAHDQFLRDQPQRTLRLCDVDRDGDKMLTVRESAKLLLDHGCTIENRDGRLQIQLPEQFNANGNLHLEAMQHVTRAARVLDAAGPLVLAALDKGGKTPLDERLPDKHAAAFGGIA